VRNFKEGEQAYYTAEAGINRAIVELMRTINSARQSKKTDEESNEVELHYWEPGSGPYTFDLEGTTCEVVIEDEGNKIGLNAFLQKAKKNPTILKKLLQDKIGLEGEKRDIVADSLIDWYDKNHNITGVNGAEDDYYQSLDIPYECRDGEIPVIEELLLIRGIDEEIYYGKTGKPEHKIKLTSEELEQLLSGNALDEQLPEEEESDNEIDEQKKVNLGLANIFSVYSKTSTFKPNINTASVGQLLLLEGIDLKTAQEIVDAKNERRFESLTDRLPQFKNYDVWKNNIRVIKKLKTMGYYKIKARGLSPDGRITRSITCNVRLTRSRCVIISWKAMD
jgi:type II secretory pathway component PulK